LFAQKEPKSLPPNTLHRLDIYTNAFVVGDQPPLGGGCQHSPDPLAGFKGHFAVGRG